MRAVPFTNRRVSLNRVISLSQLFAKERCNAVSSRCHPPRLRKQRVCQPFVGSAERTGHHHYIEDNP